MGKYKRIRVSEKAFDICDSYFTGKFPDCLVDIERDLFLKITEYENLTPDYKNREYYLSSDYYGYDGGVEFFMNIVRDETDAEYEKRVKELKKKKEKEREGKEKKKEEELALLEKLKKKYEGKV